MKLFGDNRGVLRTLCLILHLPVHPISLWAIFRHPIRDINMASKNQSSRLTFAVMMDVATTALQVLGSELFKQLTAK